MDWIIVGLGNPGAKYAETRHNIGWMVVEKFAQKYHATFTHGKGDWHEARCTVHDQNVLLMLPTTYMNLSGTAAAHAQKFFKTPATRFIAVVDEYNFPVGRIHIKNSGSNGGHNGTASMIEELGTDKFVRLRCGIDKNFGPGELVQYVLQAFAPDEILLRDDMIQKSIDAIETILEIGLAKAMQTINRQ
ncbi:MAG: aminoacyl-tRNA hydrolase [Candidatus Kapaibacterium sp.]|nr:MAG: aminoacyl-tRNA hydrolase [Candidatus Kapabacteria bacterium]